ncbi:MAG TPA: hypothetical protein VIL30_12030 [Ramlibacter sp.]|jgi:hypothetical protein
MGAIGGAYALVERFALVYVLGLTFSLVSPIYLGFRTPPWFAQTLLVLACLATGWSFARKRRRGPSLAEYLLALAGCAAVLVAIKLYLAHNFAAAAGMDDAGLLASMLRRTFWEVLLIAALIAPWIVKGLAGKTAPPVAPTVAAKARERVSAPAGGKIPLTVGFANLGPAAYEAHREEDARTIGPLFARSVAAPAGQVPSADILFLYAELNEDGTIKGLDRPVGVRQVVQATKAGIVILATDNGPGAVQAAAALPGPKTANIVFTLARKGDLLPKFFHRLFADMGAGTHMLEAWVKINPQGPVGQPDVPATLLVAEGGKLAFPRAS